MKFWLVALMLVASLGLSFEAHGAAKSMKDYKSPLVVLPPIEWTGSDPSSPGAQAYLHGVVETFGYFLFMNWTRTPENEQHFSDYRQCAENNRNRNWQISDWLKGYDPNRSAALGLIRLEIGYICQEHEGKGNGGWDPLEVVTEAVDAVETSGVVVLPLGGGDRVRGHRAESVEPEEIPDALGRGTGVDVGERQLTRTPQGEGEQAPANALADEPGQGVEGSDLAHARLGAQ